MLDKVVGYLRDRSAGADPTAVKNRVLLLGAGLLLLAGGDAQTVQGWFDQVLAHLGEWDKVAGSLALLFAAAQSSSKEEPKPEEPSA